jgi:cytochrome c553
MIEWWFRRLVIFVMMLLMAACSREPTVEISGIVNTCTTCHGPDGKSSGAVPSLYGLSEAEIIRAFEDFAMGEREATIMDRIVGAYSDAEIRGVAKYFGDLSRRDE